ncbi:hypothetical protein F9L33_14660 [Amylibacter sp. SFDW26]|uniref:hypothetical protein n=1 Tax=Amylibacter sp. SFDW26 TaxID=2652722 RepID=UPI001261BDE1|nr:hypothetical protein [Amylibacter sp. SFDW26]KAB7610134.1 hypothetical protein F9L33_14660 [Amylibacter sp. SFDW26]
MAIPEIKVKATANTASATANIKTLGRAVDGVASKTTNAAAKSNVLKGNFAQLSNVSGQTKARIQQVSFQLQDIAVQLQGGTRASVALAQQLPQLAGAFGAVGAAVGVLAAVGIPAIAFAMSSLKENVSNVEDAIKQLDQVMMDLKSTNDILDISLTDLTAKYGENSLAVVTLAQNMAELRLAKTSEALQGLTAVLGDTFSGFTAVTTGAQHMLSGGAELRDSLAKISREFGVTNQEAARLNEAFLKFEAAQTFESQQEALSNIKSLFSEMNVEASDLPPQLREALIEMGNMEQATYDAEAAANAVKRAMEKVTQETGNAATNAELLMKSLNASKSEIQPFEAPDPQRYSTIPTKTKAGGRSGRSTTNRNTELDSLVESLKTQREVLEEWRIEGLELLEAANEAELAVLGGHNEAKLRLEEEYQERLGQIRDATNRFGVQSVLKGGSDILNALGSTNKKAVKLAQAAAAAHALISTYRGAARELEKGTLGFAKAAAVVAKGAGFVAAIRSINSSSSSSVSGGTVAGSVASTTSQQSQSRTVFLDVGDSVLANSLLGQLIPVINEEIENGGQINLVQA